MGLSSYSLVKIFYHELVNLQLVRKKAIPTALATGLDIGFSNLSLKTITLSFYSNVHFQVL